METLQEAFNRRTLARYADTEAIAMLRNADPLFAVVPNYLIAKTQENQHQLPHDFPDSRGWTGVSLAEQCRPYLEAQGQWQGNGFCAIYNLPIDRCLDASFLATVVHESGHYLEWQVTTAESHGPQWIRATLHMLHRCNSYLRSQGVPALSPSDVMPMRNYGRSSPDKYQAALAGELPETSKPICWHLRQAPPLEYRQLCNADAARNGWAMPYPLTVASSASRVASPANSLARATRPASLASRRRRIFFPEGAPIQVSSPLTM